MKLSFRGANYTTNQLAVEATTQAGAGIFLGNHFNLKQASAAQGPMGVQLKYRGATYSR